MDHSRDTSEEKQSLADEVGDPLSIEEMQLKHQRQRRLLAATIGQQTQTGVSHFPPMMAAMNSQGQQQQQEQQHGVLSVASATGQATEVGATSFPPLSSQASIPPPSGSMDPSHFGTVGVGNASHIASNPLHTQHIHPHLQGQAPLFPSNDALLNMQQQRQQQVQLWQQRQQQIQLQQLQQQQQQLLLLQQQQNQQLGVEASLSTLRPQSSLQDMQQAQLQQQLLQHQQQMALMMWDGDVGGFSGNVAMAGDYTTPQAGTFQSQNQIHQYQSIPSSNNLMDQQPSLMGDGGVFNRTFPSGMQGGLYNTGNNFNSNAATAMSMGAPAVNTAAAASSPSAAASAASSAHHLPSLMGNQSFLGKISGPEDGTDDAGLSSSTKGQVNNTERIAVGRPGYFPTNSIPSAIARSTLQLPTQLMPDGRQAVSSTFGMAPSNFSARSTPTPSSSGTQSPASAPSLAGNNAPIIKPLSAYNYFFTEERDRILHGEGRHGQETNEQRRQRLLSMHISKDRKTRRPHRKTHGKISFTTLSKHIGQKWRELSDVERDFYKSVAKSDMARYKEELAKESQQKVIAQAVAQATDGTPSTVISAGTGAGAGTDTSETGTATTIGTASHTFPSAGGSGVTTLEGVGMNSMVGTEQREDKTNMGPGQPKDDGN